MTEYQLGITSHYSTTPYYRRWDRFLPYYNRNLSRNYGYRTGCYTYRSTNHNYNGNRYGNQLNWYNSRYEQARSNNIVVPITKPTPHAQQCPELYGPIRETKIVIMGHSFVTRMENRLIDEREWDPQHPTLQQQLNLVDLKIQPIIMARSSIFICDLTDWNEELSDTLPDAIVLDIGTNDICDETEIPTLVRELKEICNHWFATIDSLQHCIMCGGVRCAAQIPNTEEMVQ